MSNNQYNTFERCVGHCKSTKVCLFAKRHSPPWWPGNRFYKPLSLLSRHLPFPSSGKVPDFSAKTVHFSPYGDENPATRKD